MMESAKKAVCFGIVMFWCLCAPVFAASPHDALEKIGAAVADADAQAFQDLVDLDNVLEQGLADFLAQAQKSGSSLPPLLALMLSQAADTGEKGKNLRNMLKGEARAFVINGVSTGAFAGKKKGAARLEGMLAPLFAAASPGRKEISSVGEGRRDGEDYILPFFVHDYGNGQDYQVIGRFVRAGEGWRLARIENVDQLFEQIRKEALSQEN